MEEEFAAIVETLTREQQAELLAIMESLLNAHPNLLKVKPRYGSF